MSDQPPIMPGSVLVSCTLSCVVGGVVQTNIGDRERMWRVDDPDKLRDQLGRGLLARTPSGPGRYSESGLIDEKQGLLDYFRLASPTRMVALVPSTSSR